MKPKLSLKGRGLQLLAQREHSRLELRRKLLPHARSEWEAEAQAMASSTSVTQDPVHRGNLAGDGEERADLDADMTRSMRLGSRIGVDADADAGGRVRFAEKGRSVTWNDGEPPVPAQARRSGARLPSGSIPPGDGPRMLGPSEPAETARSSPASPEERVEAVLVWLESNKYLSEERFVESRLHARASRFGNQRIRQELAQHGVTLGPAELSALKDSELSRARAVWMRKFGHPPADAAERGRQMRFLAGRGFSGDVIRRVLQGGDDD